MSYGLQRGRQWITAPEGDGDPIPPVLGINKDPADVWLAPTIDLAIERQQLLRMCWGWATQIRSLSK